MPSKRTEGCSPEKFQKRLKETIKAKGLNQRKVAIRANINPYIITKATRHAIVPSMRTIIKIADVLEVTIPYLLGESNRKNIVKANPPSSFHERIVELAAEKEMTFIELSHEMPFARNAIYEWLRTKTIPSLIYMRALSAFFDVSLDYMAGRTDRRD